MEVGIFRRTAFGDLNKRGAGEAVRGRRDCLATPSGSSFPQLSSRIDWTVLSCGNVRNIVQRFLEPGGNGWKCVCLVIPEAV